MKETRTKKELFVRERVLFITTKNLDYLRNTQEIQLLEQQGKEVLILGSYEKSYIKRLCYVYLKLLGLSRKKFDSVFVGFAPQLIVPFFFWKFRGKKLGIDFFISLYDTMIWDRNKWKDGSFFAKLFWKLDKRTIQKADIVIADTKAHGAYFIKEFGLSKEKLKVLYLEADSKIYYKRKKEKKKEWQNKFIVLYFGSILPLQGVNIVLKSAEILKDVQDIQFVIIGPVKEKIESENITYISWLKQEDLAEWIAMSDLCLAGHFNREIQKARRTIPGKAYIYYAMGKQMILGENPANHELFEKGQKGIYFVEMGNAQKLAEKILEVKGEKR